MLAVVVRESGRVVRRGGSRGPLAVMVRELGRAGCRCGTRSVLSVGMRLPGRVVRRGEPGRAARARRVALHGCGPRRARRARPSHRFGGGLPDGPAAGPVRPRPAPGPRALAFSRPSRPPNPAGAGGPAPGRRRVRSRARRPTPATCRPRPAAPPPGVPGTPPTTAHTLADLRLVPRGTPWNASVRRPSPVRRRSPPGQVPAVRGARAVREPRTAPRPHGPTAARGPCRRAGARGHRAGQAPAPPPGRPREGTGE